MIVCCAKRNLSSELSDRPAAARLPALLLAATLAGGLAGCGVRGNLEAPPEAKAAGQATTPDAADAAGSSAKEKPHKGFILDGLIR
jgi:predicted small lipoprotein YifL